MESPNQDAQTLLLSEIDSQISWYSHKAKLAKKCDFFLQLAIVTITAAIPVLVVFNFAETKYLIAILSALAGIIEGSRNIFKFRENWILYRSTLEELKQEKITFMTGTGGYYQLDEKLNFLSNRYLSILNQERFQWRKKVYQQDHKNNERTLDAK